jgi:hypothetical protein
MSAFTRRVRVGFVAVVVAVAGCAISPDPVTHIPGTERMPAPASVWLTADPASPPRAVTIEMTSPDSDMRRTHTFPAGEAMRGSFPVSQGRYRLTGQGGSCILDLVLLPERETDVIIELRDEGCAFAVVVEHGYDSGITHEEPAVLVAPGSVP